MVFEARFRSAGVLLLALAASGCFAGPPKRVLDLDQLTIEERGRRARLAANAALRPDREAAPKDDVDRDARPFFLERVRRGAEQPAAAELTRAPSPSRVDEMGLEATAEGDAPGMIKHREDGRDEPLGATLIKGGLARKRLGIKAGVCVTVVAQGGLGVGELDLFLTRGDGASIEVVAEDPERGSVATIGKRGRCVTTAGDEDLYVVARRGEGRVLVQIYEKSKP